MKTSEFTRDDLVAFLHASPTWYKTWQESSVHLFDFVENHKDELIADIKRPRFEVTFSHFGHGNIEWEMVQAIVAKMMESNRELYKISLNLCEVRKPDGFLMYHFGVQYTLSSKMIYMGCVQRIHGGEYEFHS